MNSRSTRKINKLVINIEHGARDAEGHAVGAGRCNPLTGDCRDHASYLEYTEDHSCDNTCSPRRTLYKARHQERKCEGNANDGGGGGSGKPRRSGHGCHRYYDGGERSEKRA
jgi:hypothetical protein